MFGKIKDGTKAYGVGADEQAALMQTVLELNGKRIKIADDWDAKVDKLLAFAGGRRNRRRTTICARPTQRRTPSALRAGVSS